MTGDQQPAAGQVCECGHHGDAHSRVSGYCTRGWGAAGSGGCSCEAFRPAAPPADTAPDDSATADGPVLVARCTNRTEPDGALCLGLMRYRWGQAQAACDTCGGQDGVAVADWLRVEHARPDAERLSGAREAMARRFAAREVVGGWDRTLGWAEGDDMRRSWLADADELLSLPAVLAWAGRDQQDGAR